MSTYDPDALRAAAESAAAKSAAGDSGTDVFAADGLASSMAEGVAPAVPLETSYLGLSLRNPIVAGAGPLTGSVSKIVELADAGVGAIVLHSLMAEQLAFEQRGGDVDTYTEAQRFFPAPGRGQDSVAYLQLVREAVKASPVPVIASLGITQVEGWLDYALRIQDAGAAGLELSVYQMVSSVSASGREVEQRYLDLVQAAKASLQLPVAIKLGPYFSAPATLAHQLEGAGADGLVLFHRFQQPDIDLSAPKPKLVPALELATSDEGRLARAWIAAIRGQVSASLAGNTGVDSAADVIKYILSGADVVATTGALIRHGVGFVRDLVAGLRNYLVLKDYTLEQARGLLAVPPAADRQLYAREGYLTTIETETQRRGW